MCSCWKNTLFHCCFELLLLEQGLTLHWRQNSFTGIVMTAWNDISALHLRRSESTVWQLTSVGDTILSKCNMCTKSQISETWITMLWNNFETKLSERVNFQWKSTWKSKKETSTQFFILMSVSLISKFTIEPRSRGILRTWVGESK